MLCSGEQQLQIHLLSKAVVAQVRLMVPWELCQHGFEYQAPYAMHVYDQLRPAGCNLAFAASLPSSRRLLIPRMLGMLCLETCHRSDACIRNFRSVWQDSWRSPVLTGHSSVVM